MKKGISLIVLVITIIVMIIIAGAIIISLNSTSVIDKANTAVTATDVSTLNDKLSLAYVDLKLSNQGTSTFSGSVTVNVNGTDKTYESVTKYYEDVVPEIKDLSKYQSAGYALTINTNGSATIAKYLNKK